MEQADWLTKKLIPLLVQRDITHFVQEYAVCIIVKEAFYVIPFLYFLNESILDYIIFHSFLNSHALDDKIHNLFYS